MINTSVYIFFLSIFIFSCNNQINERQFNASGETLIDSISGSCPFLTSDDKENVVLSWIRQIDTSSFKFCYAVSDDNGKTFKDVKEIPGSTNVNPHGENLPKIIFKHTGEIIAVWGAANPNPGNKYAGMIYYSQSFDKGETWTKPKNLSQDTSSFDQRYFDVAILKNGEAGIVWLDNRKRWDKEGSGVFYAVTEGRNGFQNEKLVSGPACQCCRTDILMDKHGSIHVLYRAIINDSIRDVVHIVSTDDGKSFSTPQRISQDNWVINGCPHTGPAMSENKEGIHFTWFTGGMGAGIYYNHSGNNGETFDGRDSVSGNSAKHCQIATLNDENILIVWNESFPMGKEFSSRIGIEKRDAQGKILLRNYITAENSKSTFPVVFSLSDNTAVVAYTDNSNGSSHIFSQMISF